ncbi:MAG: DUF433 domain-containing protein [Coleofasciculus sp. C1-SOL-03]|uniref:DUF433 domain-containing protein n=1 Tax=Coleofasciculus sp. C1-SOL-03 TaxID=3069522 RepID=UPI0032F1D0C6
MQLEDYLDFITPDDIRIKGTRIGIETILYEYIYRRRTAEEIAQTYSSLTLEQVYATILYYLHYKETVSNYIGNWLEYCLQSEQEQDNNPPPAVVRLLKLKAEQESGKVALNENSRPNYSHSFKVGNS